MRFEHQPSDYCDECRRFRPHSFDEIDPKGNVIGAVQGCYYAGECQHIVKLIKAALKYKYEYTPLQQIAKHIEEGSL